MAINAELVSTLRARGVTISDSEARKTSLATLEQMVAELPIDIDAASPDADRKVIPIRASMNREPRPAALFRPTAPGSNAAQAGRDAP